MHKWYIDIVMKGSGIEMPCVYHGPEKDSLSVMQKIFGDKTANEWVGLDGLRTCNGSSTFVLVGEIASIDIYERK